VGPFVLNTKLLGFNYNLAQLLNKQTASQPVSQPNVSLAPSPTAQLPPTMAGEVPPPPLAYMRGGAFALQKICSSRNLQKIPDCLLEGKQDTQNSFVHIRDRWEGVIEIK
jgi:hypothetical protein